ncbi:MAG: DNA methyltransferase [Gemmatimonadetes bacterium]|nr:DNA methyltransferase [Gemmatimonadota bacterium]
MRVEAKSHLAPSIATHANKPTKTRSDPGWSFEGERDITSAHGFYTYPAKFVSGLARRLILEYSREGELVIDPFMGSGTTLLEAMAQNRRGLGVDVNEIAVLVSKVKTTPLNQTRLQKAGERVLARLEDRAAQDDTLPKRIDYWFAPDTKRKLLLLRTAILSVRDKDIRDFLLVAFAQILKSCSIWLQKSVKPTRHWDKKEIDPWTKFEWQVKRMLRQHEKSWENLDRNPFGKVRAENADCRNLPCKDGEAALVVTSPPYVTSYEYADLHQLPALWLGHLEELVPFRQKFIGSQGRTRTHDRALESARAERIVKKLGQGKKAASVRDYFADMLESFEEIKRVLRPGGKAAIVIGDTKMQGAREGKVEVANAEVFEQQCGALGFRRIKTIERKIPCKMLPSTRDKATGRFATNGHDKKHFVYPKEYILVMEK